jgi:hypothetical protein
VSCNAPGTLCGGECVDASSDVANCGSCGHDCQGGGCLAGRCQPVTLATNLQEPVGIAVDATSLELNTSTSPRDKTI